MRGLPRRDDERHTYGDYLGWPDDVRYERVAREKLPRNPGQPPVNPSRVLDSAALHPGYKLVGDQAILAGSLVCLGLA